MADQPPQAGPLAVSESNPQGTFRFKSDLPYHQAIVQPRSLFWQGTVLRGRFEVRQQL